MQPIKRLMTFGVAALVVAGCGGGGSSSPTTTPAAVTIASVESTTSTTTPATSSTAVAATTTTLPPETTTTVATEDLIKKAVQDYFEAYVQCGTVPATCDPATFTATQGPSRGVLNDFVKGLVTAGLYFSADRRGQYLVAESVHIDSPSDATANYCLYDSGIVMGPIGPDGQPTVVNDVISSTRYLYEVFFEEGTWKVGRQHEIERLGEGNLCPPSA